MTARGGAPGPQFFSYANFGTGKDSHDGQGLAPLDPDFSYANFAYAQLLTGILGSLQELHRQIRGLSQHAFLTPPSRGCLFLVSSYYFHPALLRKAAP
jgi:hypothetical protein